jgi:hypothetical protein
MSRTRCRSPMRCAISGSAGCSRSRSAAVLRAGVDGASSQLLSSIDGARRQFVREGRELLDRAVGSARRLRERLAAEAPELPVIGVDDLGARGDGRRSEGNVSVADDVRQQITKRLEQLKLLGDEYHQLEGALADQAPGPAPSETRALTGQSDSPTSQLGDAWSSGHETHCWRVCLGRPYGRATGMGALWENVVGQAGCWTMGV